MSAPEALVGLADRKMALRIFQAFSNQDAPCSVFSDGAALWDRVGTGFPGALVLQWNLRKVSGLEILFRVRQRPRTKRLPVALLVPEISLGSYLESLNPRPDFFIFSEDDIDAIVRQLWAPVLSQRAQVEQPLITCNELSLDPNTIRATWRNRDIRLSPDEFRLLRHLLEHRGEIVTRNDLLASVWQRKSVTERTIDVVIGRVRNAIARASGKQIIRTVRGQGYVLLKL